MISYETCFACFLFFYVYALTTSLFTLLGARYDSDFEPLWLDLDRSAGQ